MTVPEGYHYLDTAGDTYPSLLIKSINVIFDQYREQCIQEIKSYLEDYNDALVADYISKSEDSILTSYQYALRD